MRRSIDDQPFDAEADPVVAGDPDLQQTSWAVAIADDYDDAELDETRRALALPA